MKISFIAAWCAALTFSFSADMRSATPPKDIDTVVKMLDIYMDKAMEATGVPGAAVAIVYQDKVVFLKGYGVRKLAEEAKVDADTVFQLASLSKPIASTVVASLIKTGQIEWDDPVRKFDPRFTLSDPVASEKVTLRDLFAHRSGIPAGGGDVLEDLGYSRPEVLFRLRSVPLVGELGKTSLQQFRTDRSGDCSVNEGRKATGDDRRGAVICEAGNVIDEFEVFGLSEQSQQSRDPCGRV